MLFQLEILEILTIHSLKAHKKIFHFHLVNFQKFSAPKNYVAIIMATKQLIKRLKTAPNAFLWVQVTQF